jgi:hypothetical protein
MSVQPRTSALKGHQTCRFLALSSVDIAAQRSRSTRRARPIAITVPVACGPGTLIATPRATGRPVAQATWSRSRSRSAANVAGC